MTKTSTATATNGHYTVTAPDGRVIEFNHKNTFAYVVIGRIVGSPRKYYGNWNVWARTNQPRGAEKKWTTWGGWQAEDGLVDQVEVLIVPVEHR